MFGVDISQEEKGEVVSLQLVDNHGDVKRLPRGRGGDTVGVVWGTREKGEGAVSEEGVGGRGFGWEQGLERRAWE